MNKMNDKVTIKQVFETLETAMNIMDKSYTQYDSTTKLDILYDFKYEFLEHMDHMVRNSDSDQELDVLYDLFY